MNEAKASEPLVVLARMPPSAAHALAADVVGEWWGRPAYALRFERGEHGKPYVVDADGAPGPPFNVSHSGDWIAVAVAGSGPVGVDVERVRPVKPRVARRLFGTSDMTPDSFTYCWTVAEACVKADGRGVGLLLDEGFGPLSHRTTGTWRGFRYWSGGLDGAYWAVALGDGDATEPEVRVL